MSSVFFLAAPSTPLGLRHFKNLESASYALDSARSPPLQEPRVCKLRPRLRSVSAVIRTSNLEQSAAQTCNLQPATKAKRQPAT
jgi:hypothetical protein